MKIRPEGAELFHADRRMDRHDKVNSRFSQNLRTRLIIEEKLLLSKGDIAVNPLTLY